MGSGRGDDIAALQRAFMDAPFSQDGWSTAIKQLARATRSSRAQIVGIGDAAVSFNLIPDIEDGYEAEFVEIGAYRPDVSWRIAASGRPLEIISERHYDTVRAGGRSGIYDEHCRRWGGINGCQTSLIRDAGQLIGLATVRNERDGRTTDADRRIFAAGARHALAAVRLQQAIAHRGATLLAGSMEALGVAVFLLGGNGLVAAISPEAEGFVRGSALTLRGGRLGAVRPDADRLLQQAVHRALAPDQPEGLAQQLWIASHDGREFGLRCELFRLPQRDFAFGFDPRVAVIVRRGGDIPAVQGALLRQMLALTAAEADIALGLANGMDRERIARERGTSPQTLATQIKAILHKAGVGREGELIALVNRLLR